MSGSRRGLAATGAGLALVAALPLGIARIAGAAESPPATRGAIVVLHSDGATAVLSDGDARMPLPWLQAGDSDVAVSPSGRRIAFSSSRAGNRELYVVDVVSGELARLTWSRRREDVEPAWAPDGATIAWASGTEIDHDLFRIRFDRTGLRRLTRGSADDREPDWAPDGRAVAFASDRAGRLRPVAGRRSGWDARGPARPGR